MGSMVIAYIYVAVVLEHPKPLRLPKSEMEPELPILTERLPKSELDRLILANSLILSQQGYLSKNSLDIAIKLSISVVSYETAEVEEEHLQSL